MAPKGSPIEAALERFGREVIVQARDNTIASHEARLANTHRPTPSTAGHSVHQLGADYVMLAAMPEEQRAMIRRLIVQATDSALGSVLKYLDDLESRLIIDGHEILECVSGETHGLPLTRKGWNSQYSKYGEYGDGGNETPL